MLRQPMYSWQVAPQQSLLPLPAGRIKVMDLYHQTAGQQRITALFFSPDNYKNGKEKRSKKERRKGNGLSPIIFFC